MFSRKKNNKNRHKTLKQKKWKFYKRKHSMKCQKLKKKSLLKIKKSITSKKSKKLIQVLIKKFNQKVTNKLKTLQKQKHKFQNKRNNHQKVKRKENKTKVKAKKASQKMSIKIFRSLLEESNAKHQFSTKLNPLQPSWISFKNEKKIRRRKKKSKIPSSKSLKISTQTYFPSMLDCLEWKWINQSLKI